MELYLKIILIACALAVVAIVIYILVDIHRRFTLKSIYDSDVRDYRFVCAILKLYFKKALIRNPYLRKNLGRVPPRADAVLVLKGGIVIITVIDKPGFYITPIDEDWSVTVGERTERIDNALHMSKEYEDAIETLLMKSGIECSLVYNVVVLSDDHAEFDPLYPDGILTGNMLVPYCRRIANTRGLSAKQRREIKELIVKNHKICKEYLEKNVYNSGGIL